MTRAEQFIEQRKLLDLWDKPFIRIETAHTANKIARLEGEIEILTQAKESALDEDREMDAERFEEDIQRKNNEIKKLEEQ